MPICREPASWHTMKKRSAKFRVSYKLRITNPIIVNELDIIEQLTIAAEQAGANLAPTYQEYMPLAFAIANSCGEAGRSFFTGFAVCLRSIGRPTLTNSTTTPYRVGEGVIP